MSKNINNLVRIAKILKELKEERELVGIPEAVMSRYPEGSEGIVINEDKFIVLNTLDTSEVKETDRIHELKDANLKYNVNFFLSTRETDEPDIIDESHNKSKLINEAYTEVSFLPKDIYSQAQFNSEEAKAAIRGIIDRSSFGPHDFDDYRVESNLYSSGNVFDEIYRCRCVFHDISGNESVESLLIKAFKVSNQKGAEYSYRIINSEDIKEQVEQLEQKVSSDKSGEMYTVFARISNEEYAEIERHIKEGISKYYEENSKKYYRLTRVDIKAIYCLRLKKTPIVLNLLVDNSIIASLPTFYSMVAGEFNVFTCPNCNTLSSDSYDGIKIHVDHDFVDMDEDMLGVKRAIGCSHCMERCKRCGAWHFKLKDYNQILGKNFNPITKRRFLRNYADTDVRAETLCSCKEYLTWVYDEMSLVTKGGKTYYERIVDKFLSGGCKLAFVNYLTGEVIAQYDDFVNYLHEYLLIYLKKNGKIHKKSTELKLKDSSQNEKRVRIHNFADIYIENQNNEFSDFKLEQYVEQAILDYKKSLADALNLVPSNIKITTLALTETCSCCGGSYFTGKNSEGESYFSSVKNSCRCCDEATSNGYRIWSRVDDGVTFYRPKGQDKAIRTYQSESGEQIYEEWLKGALLGAIDRIKTSKR